MEGNKLVTLNIECNVCHHTTPVLVYTEDLQKYLRGDGYIQDIFHYLSPAHRELIMSQICDTCFHEMFKELF